MACKVEICICHIQKATVKSCSPEEALGLLGLR